MVRKWGEQIIRSRQYASGVALIVAFISCFDVPIGWLSTVIIALVTLQTGSMNGLIVTAWAILPALAMAYLGQYAVFINITLLHYFVVWFFAVILRRYNSWTGVIQISALIGMLTVITIHYFLPDLHTWLVNELTRMAREFKTLSVFNFQPAEYDTWVKYIGLFATGFLTLALVLTNLFTLFLARWWQATFVPVINLQKECYSIRMPLIASLLLLLLMVGMFTNAALFVNVLLVALAPFVLASLSLLHAYLATKKNGQVFMFIFYFLFLFLSPYFMLMLTLVGWLDSLINFRKRFLISDAVEE